MSNLGRESIHAVAERWAEIMWAISWQFCVLVLAVLIIHWSLRRAAPNWRYWLWQILAIKLLLMPVWTAALPWTSSKPGTGSNSSAPVAGGTVAKSAVATQPSIEMSSPLVVSATSQFRKRDRTSPGLSDPTVPLSGFQTPSPVVNDQARADVEDQARTDRVRPRQNRDQLILVAPDTSNLSPNTYANTSHVAVPIPSANSTLSWRAWLMLAWVLGVGWYASRIIWQGISLGRRLRAAQPAEAALVQRVRDVAAQLKLSRVPRVLILDAEISPFVCGVCRTTLVLPRAVTETFTPEQLDLVLLHELAHIQRRDLIWGWIPEIGRVLFFFHPLVYVVCNQIRFERELACDQLAMLSSGRDAATYADTLVRVVGQVSARDSIKRVVTESPQISS